MDQVQVFLPGKLTWTDGKQQAIEVRIDRMAVWNGKLALLSCVAPVASLKSMRAALSVVFDLSMSVDDVELRNPKGEEYRGNIYSIRGGYSGYFCKLCYDQSHAIFVSRHPGIMLDDSDTTLWLELKRDRYSTPLLRAWLPYLKSELRKRNLIVDFFTVNCTCSGLSASPDSLDEIVEEGIKTGRISITSEEITINV